MYLAHRSINVLMYVTPAADLVASCGQYFYVADFYEKPPITYFW